MTRLTFILPDGTKHLVEAQEGLSLLEVAHTHDLPLEGACGGSLACATCHVILEEPLFNTLTPATEQEEDMLDLAFDPRPTSRLGCQILVTDSLEGAVITLPGEDRHIVSYFKKNST